MILSHKCGYCSSLVLKRNLSRSAQLYCNPYRVLGLTPSATLSEIKSAFYELSKKYHPDKNQGCEKSLKKFRDINAAYEILRDDKLRLKCDRQLYQSGMSGPACAYPRCDYNNTTETSNVKTKRQYGKTKYYDYDAWYRAHYVNSYDYKEYGSHDVHNDRPIENSSSVNPKPFKFGRLINTPLCTFVLSVVFVYILTSANSRY